MVCDCVLTKEEISRGEMGCGEDCLNRLLMIEWYVNDMLHCFVNILDIVFTLCPCNGQMMC